MKFLLSVSLAALLGLGSVFPAHAGDRYRERPPVMVSPDLSAPWVMQLSGMPEGGMQRRVPMRRLALPPQAAQPEGVRVAGYAAPGVGAGGAGGMGGDGENKFAALHPIYLPQEVAYSGGEKPGTIVIDTRENFLYLVEAGAQARRYGVGTGKPGFEWSGTHAISRKQVWPDWRPPAEMVVRERAKGKNLPEYMPGGPANPLGARALYLGSTLYRIHGTNQPWTIGGSVSSGCIRMRNEDVVDLYGRVNVGTRVVVM